MSSPIIFGGNNTASNLQNAILNANGALLKDNGPKNYITYNNFENGVTTGWSLGITGALTNGIPTASPFFGGSASSTLSISAVTSGAIAQNYSLQYLDSATTTVGNMVASNELLIDLADQAKVLTWRFNYKITTGTTNANFSGTSANSLGVAVFDVTNNVWLPNTGNFAMTQKTGVGVATGTFQTASNTASIRLVIYNVTAVIGGLTMLFDDFYLGPQAVVQGSPITDWTDYTPISNWTTNTVVSGKWRRVGQNIQIQAVLRLSGAPNNAGTDPTISLPNGLAIDTTKLLYTNNSSGSIALLPGAGVTQNSTAVAYNLNPFVNGNDPPTVFKIGGLQVITTHTGTVYPADVGPNPTQPFTYGANTQIQITAEMPIVGWSSQVQMSNDTDTRIIAWQGTNTANTSINNTATIVPFTTTRDTAGGWGTNSYTVPVSGFYRVSASLQLGSTVLTAAQSFSMTLFVDSTGVQLAAINGNGSANFQQITGSTTVYANAGQVLQLKATNSTAGSVALNSSNNYMSIERLSGPAVVAATETVVCRYTSTSATAFSSSTLIPFANKIFDSHNAYNTSTGTYTVPVSGKYRVSAQIVSSANLTTVQTQNIQIYYQNASYCILGAANGNGTTITRVCAGADIVQCNAGDTLAIYAFSDVATTLSTTAGFNRLVIERVGN